MSDMIVTLMRANRLMEFPEQTRLSQLLRRGVVLLGCVTAAEVLLYLALRKDTYLQFAIGYGCGLALVGIAFFMVRTVKRLDVPIRRSSLALVKGVALGVAILAFGILALRMWRGG